MKALAVMLSLVASATAHAQTGSEGTPAFTSKGAFFALSVADIDASARWYQEKLGLKIVMDPPKFGKTRIKALEGNGVVVELIQNDDAKPRGLLTSGENEALVHGPSKAGVIVEDWDQLLATLKARQVSIFIGPFPPRREQRANLIIKDNEGNLIQFLGDYAK